MEENFDIRIRNDRELVGEAPDGTTIVTTFEEAMEGEAQRRIMAAFENKYHVYSPYTKDRAVQTDITFERIGELADGVQSDINKVITLNGIIRRFILTDDIIGKVYESLETNLNTDFKLSYNRYDDHRNKQKKLDKTKAVINEFNYETHIKQVIRDAIPLTFAEGNYITYLRTVGDSYIIDYLPLGIAYIEDYTYADKPVVCIDVNELTRRMSKTYKRDKKNKEIFFKNIEEDIKNNYPPEVYEAYKKKESIARLDPERTGVMRICNMKRKYGVSPIVRALRSALMLENIENADYVNNKAKSKKIIHQILRKEGMGENLDRKFLAETAYAHGELMSAWGNRTVVYTSPPYVEKIQYVEPSVEDTSSDKINVYRSKIMTTLGIGFIDSSNANFSVANISLDQLMKTINSISEQLERIIMDFYKIVLKENNIDLQFLPDIKIIDAEQLSMDIKKDLVELMYSKLNCSLESSLAVLGISLEDEKMKRTKENDEKLEEVFFPRKTSYTAGNDNEGGRPADSNNLDKQAYDGNREDTL